MTSAKAISVHLGRQGRIVIPAPLREQLGLAAGDTLVAREEDGRLILEKTAAVTARLRARFAHVAPGRSLADELIAERRTAAALEQEA